MLNQSSISVTTKNAPETQSGVNQETKILKVKDKTMKIQAWRDQISVIPFLSN